MMKVDFVCDLSCGWSLLGFLALRQALLQVDELGLDMEIRPFELHPGLPAEGLPLGEHFVSTYGADLSMAKASRQAIASEAGGYGFVVELGKRTHIFKTFDGHRLLRWARTLGGDSQARLLDSFYRLTFQHGESISNHEHMLARVAQLGLDVAAARAVLESQAFADEVLTVETAYRNRGLDSTPSMFINGVLALQGSQAAETIVTVLRAAA